MNNISARKKKERKNVKIVCRPSWLYSANSIALRLSLCMEWSGRWPNEAEEEEAEASTSSETKKMQAWKSCLIVSTVACNVNFLKNRCWAADYRLPWELTCIFNILFTLRKQVIVLCAYEINKFSLSADKSSISLLQKPIPDAHSSLIGWWVCNEIVQFRLWANGRKSKFQITRSDDNFDVRLTATYEEKRYGKFRNWNTLPWEMF